jgi:hypothetical protein
MLRTIPALSPFPAFPLSRSKLSFVHYINVYLKVFYVAFILELRINLYLLFISQYNMCWKYQKMNMCCHCLMNSPCHVTAVFTVLNDTLSVEYISNPLYMQFNKQNDHEQNMGKMTMLSKLSIFF